MYRCTTENPCVPYRVFHRSVPCVTVFKTLRVLNMFFSHFKVFASGDLTQCILKRQTHRDLIIKRVSALTFELSTLFKCANVWLYLYCCSQVLPVQNYFNGVTLQWGLIRDLTMNNIFFTSFINLDCLFIHVCSYNTSTNDNIYNSNLFLFFRCM